MPQQSVTPPVTRPAESVTAEERLHDFAMNKRAATVLVVDRRRTGRAADVCSCSRPTRCKHLLRLIPANRHSRRRQSPGRRSHQEIERLFFFERGSGVICEAAKLSANLASATSAWLPESLIRSRRAACRRLPGASRPSSLLWLRRWLRE